MPLSKRLAYIDLSARKITSSPISQGVRQRFLGGRGIDMLLLRKLALPSADPLGWDNTLIFGTGYGDPLKRKPELVLQDVLDRRVSLKVAAEEQDIVID